MDFAAPWRMSLIVFTISPGQLIFVFYPWRVRPLCDDVLLQICSFSLILGQKSSWCFCLIFCTPTCLSKPPIKLSFIGLGSDVLFGEPGVIRLDHVSLMLTLAACHTIPFSLNTTHFLQELRP